MTRNLLNETILHLMSQTAPKSPNAKRDALADRLTAHFAPKIADLGLELVQLRLLGSPRAALRLDVRIDRPAGKGAVRLGDCSRVSRMISADLDAFDLIPGHELAIDVAYELEVSSPGMDRILRHEADFARFVGLTAKVVVEVEGEKETIIGVIHSVHDGVVELSQGSAKQKGAQKQKAAKMLEISAIVQANLAPTFAEWLALGERLKAENAAAGESAQDDSENDDNEDDPDNQAVANADD